MANSNTFLWLVERVEQEVDNHYNTLPQTENRFELQELNSRINALVLKALEWENEQIQESIKTFIESSVWPKDMNLTPIPDWYIESLLYYIYKTNNYLELEALFRKDHTVQILQFFVEFGALELLCEKYPKVKENIIEFLKEDYRLDETNAEDQTIAKEIEGFMNKPVPVNSYNVMKEYYPSLNNEDFQNALGTALYIEVKNIVFSETATQ